MTRPYRAASLALLLATLPLLAGCSSSGQRPGSRVDRTRLEAQEIQAGGFNDAYMAVTTLRPNWLRQRGISSINLQESVKVYVDNTLVGGPEMLREITVNSITSIRYMDGLEATQRWGLDHGVGAILVFTMPPR
jgi:hypothetical protein